MRVDGGTLIDGAANQTVGESTGDGADEWVMMRKIWMRILVFGFLLLLFAQVDKHNIAFAGLTMRGDLGLSATVFAARR